jgi:D-glycero-alpha-D-manno-heptose-7-phosphate kinase
MIISRAPVRITLGGGGTDLPSYYEKYGGYLISGAINKHVYVSANKQFYNNYFLKYAKMETTEDVNKIEHNLIRESIKLLNIGPGIEITAMADIPSGTGLGSSGAFLVSLLNTLHHYKGENPSKRQLAEEACKIELDILKEHEGKQDKYVCSMAGIKAYEFFQDGKVSVIPLANEDIVMSTLKEKLFLFFTGQKRVGMASDALKNQDEKVKANDADMIDRLHLIKKIGIRTKEVFDSLDFDTFGSLLDQHWEIKKQYSPTSTNPFIDNCYKVAKDNGVLGGKIMGASGGGFFMFYHPGESKEIWKFVSEMEKLGLRQMKYDFDTDGVTIISKEREI